ncbi:MAG: hypothetical protein K2O93_01645, partial [Oscillospiraceae bacterium]|nr:hypothetical protein [Oscillospiraceae bacterium]
SWAPSFVGRSSARLPAELALYFEQSGYPNRESLSTAVKHAELYESMVHTIQAIEAMGWGEFLAER